MKDKLTTSRHINAILMKFTPSKKDVLFLVEGKTDKIIFKKFIYDENVHLESGNGFFNLLEIVEGLRARGIKSFVAVMDSDFRALDDEYIKDDQIFFTDYHDIEVSIIESKSFEVILEKYASEEKLKKFHEQNDDTFKERIYSLSRHLGFLKWANKNEDLGLAFKPKFPEGKLLKLEKFIKADMTFDGVDRMINYIIQYSQNRGGTIKSYEEIHGSYQEYISREVDLKHLCNGHDLSYIIAISFKKSLNNKSITCSEIENDLRLSYDSNCFKQTRLFDNMNKWQSENTRLFI